MPKGKTHKGTVKRVRVSRNGKVRTASAFTGHLNAHKSAKRKRRLRRGRVLAKCDERRVKKLLGLS